MSESQDRIPSLSSFCSIIGTSCTLVCFVTCRTGWTLPSSSHFGNVLVDWKAHRC